MESYVTNAQGLCHPFGGAYTFPPFKFQPRNGRLDLRRINALDVDRLVREQDVVALQEYIADVTFCNLDDETCIYCRHRMDPVLLKVMRLAQLTIEYLMYCQEGLSTAIAQLEARLQASLAQQGRGQQELSRQAEQLKSVRLESHQRRKMIVSLQQMLLQGGAETYHLCLLCDKAFLNATYLQRHIQRRHESVAEGDTQKQQEASTEEVEELRATLESTQEEVEALREKLRQLQEAEDSRLRERNVEKMLHEWQGKVSEDIEKQKKLFWDEFTSMLEEERKALQSHSAACANLGSLRDAASEERPQLQQALRELQVLTEQVESADRRWKREITHLVGEYEAQKIQLRVEGGELQKEKEILQKKNKMLETENKLLQKENEILEKQKEVLQAKNAMLESENERLEKGHQKVQKESTVVQEETGSVCAFWGGDRTAAAPQAQRLRGSQGIRPQEQARPVASEKDMLRVEGAKLKEHRKVQKKERLCACQSQDHATAAPEPQRLSSAHGSRLQEPGRPPASQEETLSDFDSEFEEINLQDIPRDLGQRSNSQPPEEPRVSNWSAGPPKVCEW